jgi:hypothetical protein
VPGSQVQAPIGHNPVYVDVACPSTSQCTALDYWNGVQVTFAPPAPGSGSPLPRPGHALSVSLAGAGRGSVTGTGIACPTACSGRYAEGATVALSAVAQPGSSFAGWSGGGCAGTGPCSVTMDADRAVTATFTTAHPASRPNPKPISPSKAFKLPSAKACVSRRKFSIRIRRLPGITFVRAVVIVNGKRVKTVKRSRITARVKLAGLPKGRFTVSITATTSDGRTVTGKRRYHTCARKHRRSLPKL